MFVGHYTTALLAKRAEPRLPLWALFAAAQLVDILWTMFIMLGIEELRIVPGITATNPLHLAYMPFTHSLVPATVGWALLAGFAWRLARPNDPPRGAVLIGLVVASHWLIDLPMHRRDLPLFWDCCKVGFGLWNYRIAALLVELALLTGAAAVAAKAVARPGRLWALTAFMVALQLVNVFGPQPTSAIQVGAMGLFAYAVLVAGGAWTDQPRRQAAS